MTGRLARAVDRARTIEARLENHPANPEQLHLDLKVLARRARYINAAISLCVVSAVMVALVVITLFANAFFGSGLAGTIALLFVGAMLCITGPSSRSSSRCGSRRGTCASGRQSEWTGPARRPVDDRTPAR